MTGSCECGNKPAGSIKCGEFVDSRSTLHYGVSDTYVFLE